MPRPPARRAASPVRPVASPIPAVRPALAAVLLGLLLAGCGGDGTGPGGGGVGGPEWLAEPVEVAPSLRFTEVGAGWLHTCATGADGAVYCWGKSEDGEIGSPTPPGRCGDQLFYHDVPCTGTPQPVPGAPALRDLGGSPKHTCGLDAEGRAWCWGFGIGGQLGDGQRASRPTAAPVAGGVAFVDLSVAVGGYGACAVAVDGAAYCWGPLTGGDMGLEDTFVPTAVPATLALDRVATEDGWSCGLSGGSAWCWGSNWYGQLGVGSVGQDGGLEESDVPVEVLGGHAFTRIAVSLSHTCGLREDGEAYCWGSLPAVSPTGGSLYGPTPVPAGGPAFVDLVSGGNHTCGLTAAGEAWCWGANDAGFLGDGTLTDRSAPTRVAMPAGVSFSGLALGGVHSCGLATDGRLFCWGHNGFGQVGREPGWLDR